MAHSWQRVDGAKKDHSLLTREEIQVCDLDCLWKYSESCEWLIVMSTHADVMYLMLLSICSARRIMYIIIGCFCQSCISEVTAAYDRQLFYKSNERFVILLQSHVRGYLARQRFENKRSLMMTRLPAVVKIQVLVENLSQREASLWNLGWWIRFFFKPNGFVQKEMGIQWIV